MTVSMTTVVLKRKFATKSNASGSIFPRNHDDKTNGRKGGGPFGLRSNPRNKNGRRNNNVSTTFNDNVKFNDKNGRYKNNNTLFYHLNVDGENDGRTWQEHGRDGYRRDEERPVRNFEKGVPVNYTGPGQRYSPRPSAVNEESLEMDDFGDVGSSLTKLDIVLLIAFILIWAVLTISFLGVILHDA